MLPIILKPNDKYRKFAYYDINLPAKDRLFHLGDDLMGEVGEIVKSIEDGLVFFSGEVPGFGSFGSNGGVIIIRHKDKHGSHFFSLYGHMNRKVHVGEYVTKGIEIGILTEYKYKYQGKIISAPHIHWGIWLGDNIPDGKWGYDYKLRQFTSPLKYHEKFLI